MNRPASRLPAIVEQHQKEVLAEWLSNQGQRFKEPETRDLFTKAIPRVTPSRRFTNGCTRTWSAELVRASGMEESAQASLQIEVNRCGCRRSTVSLWRW